jgi:hypothetical protein
LLLDRLSDRATPSLRDDPTATRYVINRQGIHLTNAKRCSDQADHLSTLRVLVSIRLKVEGKEEIFDLPSYERDVHIVVAPFYTIGKFISKNWQWIAATIIIPPIVWIDSDTARLKAIASYIGIRI